MATRAFTSDRGAARVRVDADVVLIAPSLARVRVGRDATLDELVSAGLVNGAKLLVDQEPTIRRDADPEGVHRARVGIRRVRSMFKVFADALDPDWVASFDDELSRMADVLGTVRDADVLSARLASSIEGLPLEADRAGGDALLRRLAGDRVRAMQALVRELDSSGYHALVARAVAEFPTPVFVDDAARPAARRVAAALVRKPWKKLRREVDALPADPAVAELHRVRIKAKRLRYACDAVAPVAGDGAHRLAKSVARLQGALGDSNDAATAEAWLRASAATPRMPRASLLTAGMLISRERAEALRLAGVWPDLWDEVRAATKHEWLKGSRR